MKQYIKLDDNTLKIVDEIVVKEAVSTYIYNDLVAQRDALVDKKTRFNLEIDAKIREAQEAVTNADNLGIVPKQDDIVIGEIIG